MGNGKCTKPEKEVLIKEAAMTEMSPDSRVHSYTDEICSSVS